MEPIELTLDALDPLDRPLQVSVTKEAAARIRVEAAKRDTSQGRIISALALKHLAPIEDSL